MRILIANNTLALLAGSETWTFALALGLKRRGHEVTCYSRRLGEVASRLRIEGIACVDDLGRASHPEVIHCQHEAGHEAAQYFKGTPTVGVSHGIIGAELPLFQPDKLVAVSEEVEAHLKSSGLRVDALIRNSVDTNRFNGFDFPPCDPKRVALVSNYSGEREYAIVSRACHLAGAKLTVTCGRDLGNRVWDVENIYAQAGTVIGLGRSLLEAMAMGRNGIVFDAGHPIDGVPQLRGDGLVDPASYLEVRKCNFSGRKYNTVRSAERLAREIEEATEANAEWSAGIVREHHDLDKALDRYEELYRSVQ